MKRIAISAAALLALCACASEPAKTEAIKTATHTQLNDCAILELTPGREATGAYTRITHTGAPVDIVKAEVPSLSQRVELHSMEMKDNVMTMVELKDVTLKEGERVFKRGADHVMLFDLKGETVVGSTHTMTLHFSDGTQASCQATVKSMKEILEQGERQIEKEKAMQQHQHN